MIEKISTVKLYAILSAMVTFYVGILIYLTTTGNAGIFLGDSPQFFALSVVLWVIMIAMVAFTIIIDIIAKRRKYIEA